MPPGKLIHETRASSSKAVGGIIKLVTTDGELESTIKNLGADKLLVIYFYLPWCGSCQKVNPSVDALATKYSHVIFLQANAEKCPKFTKNHHVYKVPLFLLFNNKVKVDRVEGASPSELEAKMRRNLAEIQYQKNTMPPSIPSQVVSPHLKMMDVAQYLNKSQCRCINDLAPTPFQAFLDGKRLISGKGVGRLILVYAFKEKMVITALKIKAPIFSGPKVLRFFVNLSKVLEFAVVSQMSSTQEILLTEEYLTGDHSIELKSGGLVGVENLQIYIPENMTKNRKTEIESLTIIGAPMSLTSFAGLDSKALTRNVISITSNVSESATSDIAPKKDKATTEKSLLAKKKVDAYAYT